MALDEEMQKWVQSHCKECSDTCCNSQKHRILLNNYSVPLFQEKGVPLIPRRKLDKHSVESWKRDKNAKLLLKDGSEVKKPSIVEIPKGMCGIGSYIYSDLCPLYSQGKGCSIHNDSRMPDYCKRYPIVNLGCNDPEGKKVDVKVMKTCECFSDKGNMAEFTKKFPVRIVD
jgi:hypothetical protein